MNTAEYWAKAALLRKVAVSQGSTVTAAEILRLYNEALEDIEKEIKSIAYNFQKRFGLDNETAAYFLTQAQQEENLKNLLTALEAAPDEKAREDILEYIRRDGLSVRAYAARTERYEAVKAVIYSRIKAMAAAEITLMSEQLKSAYKESYYGVMDDTAKGLDVGISFAVLNDKAIEEAVAARWQGGNFSERIWKNTDRLAKEAQELTVKAFMSGESLTKTSRRLAERFEVEKFHATTLIHTETAHIQAKADFAAYEELGAEEYKYLATLDYATCSVCQPLDGMVFKLSEAREGVNYPVMHPRCRCTTTINTDYINRRARNPLTGKNELVRGDMNYREWIDSLTPEQRSALELSQKKDSRKTSDKLQYEQYKKVLGKENMPKSFDKWQDLKYNDSEKYADLKGFYRYKGNNPEASRNDYNCVKELKELFPNGSFHIPAKDIDISKLGFDDKHINKEREHNVTVEMAKDYIQNAKASRTVWKGEFERYYSVEGVSFVNKEEGLIRTAFSKEEFNDEVKKIIEVIQKYGI